MFDSGGCTALVTGASSGLGAEFARQLAPVAGRLVLVARRAGRLEELRRELEARHPGLAIDAFPADLRLEESRAGLARELDVRGITVNLLVNNAGLGDWGDFASSSREKIDEIIDVNIVALTDLTHRFLPPMIAAGGGGIIHVSSLASLMPMPGFAVYAASKAYVTSFSEALRMELRDRNVAVTALCPGPVLTEFGKVAGRDGEPVPAKGGRDVLVVSPEKVVRDALAGIARDKPRVFPGLFVFLAASLIGVLPLTVLRVILRRYPRGSGMPVPVDPPASQ